MSNTKIRWAILGAGKIAHKFAKDFAAVQNAELVAVASRDAARGRIFAGQYGIPQTLSYEDLYASKVVDAVYIATPHNFHFAQSMACMESGKAVLCEKPITINDAEFRQMADCAAENKVFLMEALWTYFLPAIRQAKEWIEQGRIGNISTIEASFCFPMDFDPDSRLFHPQLAGGALLDLGVYPIAFATFFMNCKPDLVKAVATMTPTQVDESTAMLLQYGSVPAFLSCSIASQSLNTGRIIGDKGYIEIPDFFKAGAAFLYNENRQLSDSFADGRNTWGYEFETQEVTDCILRGELQSKVMPHSRSREIQEIMTEVRRQIGLWYPMEQPSENRSSL